MIFELLAPAGNLEKLKIAFLYGADAVYIAGQLFSLRQAASNFSETDLKKAISYAHDKGKKIYITVNAFLHETEIDALVEYLKMLQKIQPDALICSDMGVIQLAAQHTSIPLHVSTQASVTNRHHAEIWKQAGAKRIVVGRELSIKEAALIKEKTGLEIEMFIHGAMCMGYSGHCSMSTYVANRDSNRGGCIQNCRYFYSLDEKDKNIDNSNLLSSKDLMGISFLKQFLDLGIDSVKIEGRMKSNLYIATTVRAYANAISEIKDKGDCSDQWLDELNKIPYRGYTDGSLLTEAGKDSVFDSSKELGKEYKMAGTVIEVDSSKKRFAFQLKNKVQIGQYLEFLPFKGDVINLRIDNLVDIDEQPLAVGQPHNVIWLPWQKGIEANNVTRMM